MATRKTITQLVNETLDNLRQVGRDQQHGNVEFCSDGSRHASKVVVGKLFKIGRNARGLRLYVHTPAGTTRVASWRLPRAVVDAVIDFVYGNNYIENTDERRTV